MHTYLRGELGSERVDLLDHGRDLHLLACAAHVHFFGAEAAAELLVREASLLR